MSSILIESNISEWQEYNVIPGAAASNPTYLVVPEVPNVPLTTFIGVNGMTGQTAYYGLKEYAEMKKVIWTCIYHPIYLANRFTQ